MKFLNDEDRDVIEVKDEYWRKDFEANINSPQIWRLKAEELKRSADAVWKSVLLQDEQATKLINEGHGVVVSLSNYSTYLMLIAFSIENLLKGIYVNTTIIKYEDGKLKPKLSHDLNKIASEVGLDLDENQKHMLDRLTRSILWEGRYPTPMNKQNFYHPRTKDNIDKWPSVFIPEFDMPIIKSIFELLYNYYDGKLEL